MTDRSTSSGKDISSCGCDCTSKLVIGFLDGEAYEFSKGFFTGELSEVSLFFLQSLTLLSKCSMRLMLRMYLPQLCIF